MSITKPDDSRSRSETPNDGTDGQENIITKTKNPRFFTAQDILHAFSHGYLMNRFAGSRVSISTGSWLIMRELPIMSKALKSSVKIWRSAGDETETVIKV